MKSPFSNLNFLQLCVLMSFLAIMAVGVIFGLRGSVPPWLVGVFGGGQPPAAQLETIEFDPGLFEYLEQRALIEPAPQVQLAELEPATSPLSPIIDKTAPAQTLPSLVKGTQPQNDWHTWLAMFALLSLIGFNFRKSLFKAAN